jgi:hypothetical protein
MIDMKLRYKIFWVIVMFIIIFIGTSAFFGGNKVEPIFRIFPANFYDGEDGVSTATLSFQAIADCQDLYGSESSFVDIYSDESIYAGVRLPMTGRIVSFTLSVYMDLVNVSYLWLDLNISIFKSINAGGSYAPGSYVGTEWNGTTRMAQGSCTFQATSGTGVNTVTPDEVNITDTYNQVFILKFTFSVGSETVDSGWNGTMGVYVAEDSGGVDRMPYFAIGNDVHAYDMALLIVEDGVMEAPPPAEGAIVEVEVPVFDWSIAWASIAAFSTEYFPQIVGIIAGLTAAISLAVKKFKPKPETTQAVNEIADNIKSLSFKLNSNKKNKK